MCVCREIWPCSMLLATYRLCPSGCASTRSAACWIGGRASKRHILRWRVLYFGAPNPGTAATSEEPKVEVPSSTVGVAGDVRGESVRWSDVWTNQLSSWHGKSPSRGCHEAKQCEGVAADCRSCGTNHRGDGDRVEDRLTALGRLTLSLGHGSSVYEQAMSSRGPERAR